jgi:TetR/AcrR family transcriptional repressor of lmrAB and yxaGH operons
VALDTAAESEAIQAACDTAYEEWLRGLRAALRGWGVPVERVGPLAALVLSSLQGAILLARVQRDVSVIHQVTRQLADLL